MKKKFLSLALALMMLLSLVACGGNNNTPADDNKTPDTPPVEDNTQDTPDTPDEPSTSYTDATHDNDEIAELALGEFTEAYTKALQATNISERYVLMAIAEAKMLESGVFMPFTTNSGGLYGISRIAPYTASPALWGLDSDRVYQYLTTEEIIKSEDRSAMKAKWVELKGTGTYLEWAKQFLVDQGYTLKDTYNRIYSGDCPTWDALADNRTQTSDVLVYTLCNLLEYDVENVLQPAMAESYTVSDDGLKYTFKIRPGMVWVDNQGREVAKVTADDWVAGMQHALDNPGHLEYLVQDVIVGVNDYIDGDYDFSKVGVKALDEYTLEYTLEKDTYYFPSMLCYSLFCPMSRAYYESQGGKFGAEYDPSAESYKYGKSESTIAYCGPYLITSHTDKNSYVFKANEKFWNADAVNVKTVTWSYDDGVDVMRAYNDFIAGKLDSCGLNTAVLQKCRDDGNFDGYAFVGATDATSMVGWFNLNRCLWYNFNDDSRCVSVQDEDAKARTHAALLNQNFRMAIATGVDRGAYNAQAMGDELKYNSLINSYVLGTLVSLPEDITYDINGTPTTFTAGTNYGALVQAQIDADGFPMKVYDPEQQEGAGDSRGYDGWYNPTASKDFLDKAVAELAEQGLEISAENPIQIDMPQASFYEPYKNRAQAFKKSLEETTGGLIVVNLYDTADWQEIYDVGYSGESVADMNYDFYDFSGWGPDYGDPATYLNTLYPAGGGDMLKNIGIEG